MDVGNGLGNLGISSRVALDVRPDTLTMEGMLARVNEELTIVKDCTETDVTVLGRVDDDVSVLLMTALRTQKLRVLRVLLDLSAQLLDLLLVVIETVTKMLLHITHFGLLWEQVKQVFNLQNVVLPNDCQGLLNFDLLLSSCGRA